MRHESHPLGSDAKDVVAGRNAATPFVALTGVAGVIAMFAAVVALVALLVYYLA